MCRTINVSDNLVVEISSDALRLCQADNAVICLRLDEIFPLVAALRNAANLLAQGIARESLLAALTETARMLEEKPIR